MLGVRRPIRVLYKKIKSQTEATNEQDSENSFYQLESLLISSAPFKAPPL